MERFIELMDEYTSQELNEIIGLCRMEIRQRKQDEIEYSRSLKRAERARVKDIRREQRERQRNEEKMRKQEEWIERIIRTTDAFVLINTEDWGRRELDDIDVRQAYRLKIERCYFD